MINIIVDSSLFVLHDLCRERCLRHHMVAYEHVAFHGADAVAHRAEKLYAEKQRVAWYHLVPELHVVYFQEIG